jgi:phosphatidate cytidylyltransferase
MAGSLPQRIAVAAVGIPAAIVLVYLGSWPLVVALQVLALLGAAEVFRLAASKDIRAFSWLGYLGAGAAPLLVMLLANGTTLPSPWMAYGAVAWFAALLFAAVVRRRPSESPLSAMGVTLFGVVYAGMLPAFLLVIRQGPATDSAWAATWLVFLPLAVTWACDSMAMAGGVMFGGPKLAPVISPNKTWSGAVSGSVTAALVAPLYGWLILSRFDMVLPWWKLAVLGIVLSVVGQLGDLGESLLKREAGVKDSGGVFPGHGGVLDRLDSLYLTLPTSAMMLTAYGTI